MDGVDAHRAKRAKLDDREEWRREQEAVLSLAEQGLLDDDLSLPPTSSRHEEPDHEDEDDIDGKDDMFDESDAIADLTSEMAYSGDELATLQRASSPTTAHHEPAVQQLPDENAGFFMSIRVNKRIQVSAENESKARSLLASPTKKQQPSTTAYTPLATVPPKPLLPQNRPVSIPKSSVSTSARNALLRSAATPKLASFKSPLIRNKNSNGTSTPQRQSQQQQHRINTEIKPRPRPPVEHGFVTPFKNGVRPANLTPAGLLPKLHKKPQPSRKNASLAPTHEPVFDLHYDQPRFSLRDSLRPQTRTYEDLLNVLPVELLDMSVQSAVTFSFDGRGSHPEAFDSLVERGCKSVSKKWVENHWSLIVWTHASIVRSRPDFAKRYWSFDAVLDGLLYRYEREVNLAQRSAIKRIQERDSSAALQVVLCLSGFVRAPDSDDAKIEQLEWTDGWYFVRSSVDPALLGAVERGKLVIGSKVALVGARLDGGKDGYDPLDGRTRSFLQISGNSSTLVPWHTKLGFVHSDAPLKQQQQQPITASLGKLTSDGGIVDAIDVVVERVYPFGYLDANARDGHNDSSSSVSNETWNTEEERERRAAWEEGRAKKRAELVEASEKQDADDGWPDLVSTVLEAIEETADDVGTARKRADDDDDDDGRVEEEADEIVDRLENARTRGEKRQIVKGIGGGRARRSVLLACYEIARRRAEEARFASELDVNQALETAYPPRKVRSFCVVKVRDALVQDGDREAQLTVWDVDPATVSDGRESRATAMTMQEGNRYRITRVAPRGRWRKGDKEISLSTRIDSRITLMPSAGRQQQQP